MGASSEMKDTINPQINVIAAGMMHMTRHDFSEFPSNTLVKAGNKTEPIMGCATPPPRFPHPATRPIRCTVNDNNIVVIRISSK
eukprot:scaffold5327_cov44-Attheya_sp.AAC.2